MSDWISVEDGLPAVGTEVLIFCKYRTDPKKWYVCTGFYIPEKTVDSHSGMYDWDCEVCDYDEATDTDWVRGGWYERIHNWGDYGAVAINDHVISWLPLFGLLSGEV